MDQPLTTDLPIDQIEFVAEWEARLFAIVATLIANDVLDWADFRTNLVRLNHSRSTTPDEAELSTDLSLWAHALRSLLRERGLLPS